MADLNDLTHIDLTTAAPIMSDPQREAPTRWVDLRRDEVTRPFWLDSNIRKGPSGRGDCVILAVQQTWMPKRTGTDGASNNFSVRAHFWSDSALHQRSDWPQGPTHSDQGFRVRFGESRSGST
jgi:hypothetical protein